MFRFLAKLIALLFLGVMAGPLFWSVFDFVSTFIMSGNVPDTSIFQSKPFLIKAMFALPALLWILATAIPSRRTRPVSASKELSITEIEEVLTDCRSCISDWDSASKKALDKFNYVIRDASSIVDDLQDQRDLHAENNRAAFVLPELWEARELKDHADLLAKFVITWQPDPDEGSYDNDDVSNWRRALKSALLSERAKMAVPVPVSSVSQARSGVVFQDQPGGGGGGSGTTSYEIWKPAAEKMPVVSPWAIPLRSGDHT